MYRLVILLVAIHAIGVHSWCQHSSHCSRRHHDYKKGSHSNDGNFHELSWSVVRADRNAKRVCDEHASHTTETYFNTHYEIKVSLPDYAEDEISVKLKHRVLFIQAVKGTEKIFSELKIVPEFAKGSDASWRFEDHVLSIFVPYKITFGTEVAKVCNSTIDETVITIPKSSFDVRFAVDTTVTPLNDDVV